MKRSHSSLDFDIDDPQFPELELEDSTEVAALFQGVYKTCPHCEQKFVQNDNLRTHISNVHAASAKRRRFQCERCERSYSSRGNLNQHIREKHTESLFSCDVCGFSTTSQSYLEDHVHQKHKANRFRCLQCRQSYDTDDDLQAHIRFNHIEDRHYVCPGCGSRYMSKSSLKCHQRNTRQCQSRRE